MQTDTEYGQKGKKLSFDQLKELDAYFDRQLKESGKKRVSSQSVKKPVFSLKKITAYTFGLILCLLLPFVVLIRTSILLYSAYGLNGWLALGAGVAATAVLLLCYLLFLSFKISGEAKLHKYVVRGVIALVCVYCGYGLIYFSAMNAKSQEVSSYYHSLHPVLRITLATSVLADQNLIVTDMQRTPEDYEAMGLTLQERSLHYVQPTGYVHAVDIRTLGRAEWKNWLTNAMFKILGLSTIRHVGTADHLHVYLPVNTD